jgi:hypothetical protein
MPGALGIGLTNECNLSCAHCYGPTLTRQDGEILRKPFQGSAYTARTIVGRPRRGRVERPRPAQPCYSASEISMVQRLSAWMSKR